MSELELAERLLELLAHAVEGAVRLCGDHGADVLEGEPDRPRLERRQPRRCAERVAVELLVDVDDVVFEFCVDGVAASAEVDEVQELQVLVERLVGDLEALGELGGGNDRFVVVSAGV